MRASASIPPLFPAVAVRCNGEEWRLTDGGLSDPVPVAFAREVMGATHVIVSDCRWIGLRPAPDGNTVWIRPRMTDTGTLWSPRRGLSASIAAGEAAVTGDVLTAIDGWAGDTPSHRIPPDANVANGLPVELAAPTVAE